MSRSKQLQLRPDSFEGEAKQAWRHISTISRKLRQELLEKAMAGERLIGFQKQPGQMPSLKSRNCPAILPGRHLAKNGVLAPAALALKGMTDTLLPSVKIGTSSLFGVSGPSHKGNRPLLHNHAVVNSCGVKILYSGEQLFQSDWDVMHMLIRLSRDAFDRPHSVLPSEFLKSLNQPDNGHYYNLLEKSLNRLREACLHITVEGGRPAHQSDSGKESRCKTPTDLNLIKEVVWCRSGSPSKLSFVIDRRIAMLFETTGCDRILDEQRWRLHSNELAKKILNLISNQRSSCQHLSMAKLLDLSCLRGDMAHFTPQVIRAMQVLIDSGAVAAFWLSRPPRGQSNRKILVVWKKGGGSRREPIPGGKGSYPEFDTF